MQCIICTIFIDCCKIQENFKNNNNMEFKYIGIYVFTKDYEMALLECVKELKW